MIFKKYLAEAGIAIAKQSTLERLLASERLLQRNASFPEFIQHISPDLAQHAIGLLPFSRGEIFQDVFAALVLRNVESGYFVEFGATDGVEGSNTWLFENHLNWQGLLSEPARRWHEALRRNRSAAISEKCVWSESGTLAEFKEAREGGFSTLARFASSDRHANRRQKGRSYKVETISLNDLLDNFAAPTHIDFMSIDTEGSEFDILSTFDFKRRTIGVLTIEHNFRPEREDLKDLLNEHGYTRAPTSLSKFDDWYVSTELLDELRRVFPQEIEESASRSLHGKGARE